jgi:hypothetical protein
MLSSCNAEEDEAANMLSTSCSIDVKKKKGLNKSSMHLSRGFASYYVNCFGSNF